MFLTDLTSVVPNYDYFTLFTEKHLRITYYSTAGVGRGREPEGKESGYKKTFLDAVKVPFVFFIAELFVPVPLHAFSLFSYSIPTLNCVFICITLFATSLPAPY